MEHNRLKKLHRFFHEGKHKLKVLGGNRMSEELTSPVYDRIIKSIRERFKYFFSHTLGLSIQISVKRL